MGGLLCGCFGGECRNESKDDTDGGKGERACFVMSGLVKVESCLYSTEKPLSLGIGRSIVAYKVWTEY